MELAMILCLVLMCSCFCSACVDSNRASHFEEVEDDDGGGGAYDGGIEQTSHRFIHSHIIVSQVTEPMARSADECMICLESFERNEQIGILSCCHAFHLECIAKWYNTNQVCPLCD
jgi:hypothetical protein